MTNVEYKSDAIRLQRSELSVPGSSQKFFEKAYNSNADYILLDLEDSISPNDKLTARKNVITALNEINWKKKNKTISVRINGLGTSYIEEDILNIIGQAGDKIDTILIPKVESKNDIYIIDNLITNAEKENKLINKIGIECLIETVLAMINIKEIATSSNRLESLHFGPGDYAASIRARTTIIGGLNPDYPGDQWHYALSKLVLTCRAYGLRAIDGAFDDYHDSNSYTATAKRAAAMGLEGKWAIHPSQIDLANEVFSPTEVEVERAIKILDEIDKIALLGKGVAQFNGRMIDSASARMAKNIVSIYKLIQRKK